MAEFKAVVRDGRAVIEDLGAFPDGTELHFELVDDDELDDEQLRRLEAALERSHNEILRGDRRYTLAEILDEL